MDLEFETTADGGAWYTPDFMGNLRLPEADRAACFCTPINGREFAKLRRGTLASGYQGGRNQKAAAQAVVGFDERFKRAVLKQHVTELRNWFLTDANKTSRVEFKSIEALLDALAASGDVIVQGRRRRSALYAEQLQDELYNHIVGESTLPEGLELE